MTIKTPYKPAPAKAGVQRLLAQPILGHRRFPARRCDLVAVACPHSRSLQRHFAAVEAQLSPSPPPAMPNLAVATAGGLLRGRPPGPRRAEPHLPPSCQPMPRCPPSGENLSKLAPASCQASSTIPRRDNRGRRGRGLHGVALFRGFGSLPAQGGRSLTHLFNIGRDIPPLSAIFVVKRVRMDDTT